MSKELDSAILLLEAHAIRELAHHYRGTSDVPIWSPYGLGAALDAYADTKAAEATRTISRNSIPTEDK